MCVCIVVRLSRTLELPIESFSHVSYTHRDRERYFHCMLLFIPLCMPFFLGSKLASLSSFLHSHFLFVSSFVSSFSSLVHLCLLFLRLFVCDFVSLFVHLCLLFLRWFVCDCVSLFVRLLLHLFICLIRT